MVVCDAVLRKLPGALGHAESAVEESFSRRARGRRPSTRTTRGRPTYRGWTVPDVLLSRPPRADPRSGGCAQSRGAAAVAAQEAASLP